MLGFFWVVRKPLDVAASFCDTWNFDLADAIERQSDHPSLIDFLYGLRALIGHSARHDVCMLRYEELATHPEREIGRAFAYLSLDPPVRGVRFGRLNGGSRFGDRTILKTTAVHARSIGNYRRTFSPEQLRIIAGGPGRRLLDELGYGGTFDEIGGLGPVIDRSAELRDLASNMVEGRRRAAAEGRLQADGSAADKAAAADVRRDAELEMLRKRADRLAAENRDPVLAGSVAGTDRAARGAVIDDLQLRLAVSERDRAEQLALIGPLNLQAAQLSDDLEQSRREGAERLTLIEQLDGARSGLEVLLAEERAQAERQAAELNADRVARGEVIEHLQRRLQDADAERAALKGVIKGIERDREARLAIISTLNVQLKAAEADRLDTLAAREMMEDHVALLRAAANERLVTIESLGAHLAAVEHDGSAWLAMIEDLVQAVATLADTAAKLEAESAKRLALIEELDTSRSGLVAAIKTERAAAARQVAGLNQDRVARGEVIAALQADRERSEAAHQARAAELAAVERDREARLEVIDRMVLALEDAEADRLESLAIRHSLGEEVAMLGVAAAERLALIERLTADLAAIEADRAARGELVHALDRTLRERDGAIIALQGALAQAKRERQADQAASDARIAELGERMRELHKANEALSRQWSPRLKTMLACRR